MSLSSATNKRLDRLASEAKGGGGLPLSLFFDTALNELLDHAPVSNDRILKVIGEVSHLYSKRVAASWGGTDRDMWEWFAADIMDQLADGDYVSRDDQERWIAGPECVPGVYLTIVPERKGRNSATGTTVWEKQQREEFNKAAKVDADLNQAIRQPRGQAHGPAEVNQIRESYDKFGALMPIIKAKDQGWTLDGRHREQINPEWPVHEVDVVDLKDAVRIIVEIDTWHKKKWVPLSPGAREKIDALDAGAGQALTQNEVKRIQVAAELRYDPARSNRAIAELVVVAHHLVQDVREELERMGDSPIHRYGGAKGTGAPKHMADCWCPPDSPEREAGDASPSNTPRGPSKPRQPAIRNDPELFAIGDRLWGILGRMPTGPELVEEAIRQGFRGGKRFSPDTAEPVLGKIKTDREAREARRLATEPVPIAEPEPQPASVEESTEPESTVDNEQDLFIWNEVVETLYECMDRLTVTPAPRAIEMIGELINELSKLLGKD